MAAWPSVVARVLAVLPTLPGWSGVRVFDGPPVTSEAPTDYVTVGFVVGEEIGGSYEQTRPPGWGVQEDGVLRSELVSTTGDVDIAAVRARAFVLIDAVQAWVDGDPTLAVLSPASSSSLAVDVEPVQDTSGATVRAVLTLTYTTTY